MTIVDMHARGIRGWEDSLDIGALDKRQEHPLGDSGSQGACGNIVSMGHARLVGIWNFKGRVYAEPSFAIDHGVSEATVRGLQEFSQEAVCRITPDHAESLGRESLGQAD